MTIARPDMGRLGEGVAQPGIDSRQLPELGCVVSKTSDASGYHLARVFLYHTQTEVTAAIAQAWAGAGYGTFFDVDVDDKVLCTPILGHPDAGWVITARFWDSSTPAPAETQERDDGLILGAPNKPLRLAAQGGDISLHARGPGVARLGTDEADDPVALKSDWDTWNLALQAAISALTGVSDPSATALQALQTALGGTFPQCALKVRAV